VEVPRRQRVAGRRQVRLRAAEGDEVVAHELAGVLAVVEHRVLQRAARERALGEVLLDDAQAEAGAQRALGALVADDPREALERLRGVREPVGVVGVGHVVVAEQRRHAVRPEDAGHGGVGVAAPAAARLRAVEHRQPERRARRLAERAGRAALGAAVGDVRDGADVGVVGAAVVVGRDRVHPRDALVAALDGVELRGALRAVDLEEVVEQAEVAGVGVAHGVRRRRRPREQRRAEQRREDRPVLGRIERPRVRLERAVGAAHLHGDDLAAHLARLPVDEVGRRRARYEPQLEGREPERGGDGVAPRQVARVADEDERHAEQRGAGDVDLARDRELGLVEALGTVPREVRVAEEEPVAPGGRGPSERDGVRAEVVQRDAVAQLVEQARQAGHRPSSSATGVGGGR
jgi:hypothetical protein